MDFVNNINGMNRQQEFKERKFKKSKAIHKNINEQEKEVENEKLEIHRNDYKQEINEMQSNFAQAQGKINILQLASESLDKVSESLNETRSSLLSNIRDLKEYESDENLKIKLENISKLEQVEKTIQSSFDKNDQNYNIIQQEVENISYARNKVREISNLENDLNNNGKVKTLIEEISFGINSVSTTKESLTQVRIQLITSVKALSITLENIISAQTKIRSFELASKMVDITKSQILRQASKSVQTLAMNKDADSIALFN